MRAESGIDSSGRFAKFREPDLKNQNLIADRRDRHGKTAGKEPDGTGAGGHARLLVAGQGDGRLIVPLLNTVMGIDISEFPKQYKVITSRPGSLKLGVEDIEWVTGGICFGRSFG